MWLTGRLAPDFKTIADFRKNNGAAIRAVCSQFVVLCRALGLFTRAVVAIDGSKFKAVNNRDKNYTVAKVIGRMEQVDASIARYLRALDQADREESDIAEASLRADIFVSKKRSPPDRSRETRKPAGSSATIALGRVRARRRHTRRHPAGLPGATAPGHLRSACG